MSCRLGLIPAHAGKTSPHDAAAPQARAHPRSRGENYPMWAATQRRAGSSPLTRGKRGWYDYRHLSGGLIPAHAGKTSWPSSVPPESPAHPRSRGENGPCELPGVVRRGSSPLTRGKLARRPRQRGGEGLIPAHAGKTAPAHKGRGHTPAHPRSRGENRVGNKCRIRKLGSSPLTRGKLKLCESATMKRGLIPAHAGKTRLRTSR